MSLQASSIRRIFNFRITKFLLTAIQYLQQCSKFNFCIFLLKCLTTLRKILSWPEVKFRSSLNRFRLPSETGSPTFWVTLSSNVQANKKSRYSRPPISRESKKNCTLFRDIWTQPNSPCSCYCRLTNYDMDGRHSSMVTSMPTILRPQVRIPSTPSVLFSIWLVEIETAIGIGMRKGLKWTKKRPALAHIKKLW